MGPMLEKTGNNVWVGAVVAEGAAYGPDWKTLVLQVRCRLVLSSLRVSVEYRAAVSSLCVVPWGAGHVCCRVRRTGSGMRPTPRSSPRPPLC